MRLSEQIVLNYTRNIIYIHFRFFLDFVSERFFCDNGQQISKEEAVYSITDKGKKYQFSKESLKKLTEYYDLKSMELKQQEKIKLTLKITNAKLDEMAKEKDVQRSVLSLWKA